jgi:uncharacterized protein
MPVKGKFNWYELTTTDTKAAGAFYASVIGWTVEEFGDGSYWTFNTAKGGVAGLMKTPPEMGDMPPAWTGYVAVDDVDDFAGRYTAAGGKVLRGPAEIPGIGRFCVAADPQGAVLILFKPNGGGEGPPSEEAPGYPAWRELMAVDGARAFAFYEKMFGWEKDSDFDMGPMGVYRLFAYDGAQRGGMMNKPASIPAPYWGYYFRVDAIGAAVERLKAGGGQVTNGPNQVPTGDWIVNATDPQGAHFSLMSPTA